MPMPGYKEGVSDTVRYQTRKGRGSCLKLWMLMSLSSLDMHMRDIYRPVTQKHERVTSVVECTLT